MTCLNLNDHLINESRTMASHIIKDLKSYIDLHTTTSVERAILRMLGIDGVNALDVPYVNLLVDAIKSIDGLNKGVAHYMGYLMHDLHLSPQTIAIHVSEKKIDLQAYKNKPKCPYMHLLDPYIENALSRIKAMTEIRQEAMEKDKHKNEPYLYVIVATGNIYEDIKQAKSAAIQGADIIAVIRSTGQSLLIMFLLVQLQKALVEPMQLKKILIDATST
jgi:beta-lysine 5,6-aminomutase alpha subunit